MRQDKTDALRERLRRGAERFEFDALLQGVSTVEEEEQPGASPQPATHPPADSEQSSRISAGAEDVASADSARLGVALDTLGRRLLQEAGKLRAALQSFDASAGGHYLARVNEVLELLQSVDPGGESARRFGVPVAPPVGRVWPAPCWTVYELAESPLSGLLPADADDVFLAEIVATAVAAPED